MPITIWSQPPPIQNSNKPGIPRNVLITANDWMYENAWPHTRIHPTYSNLGRGIWEIEWTWQISTGEVYQSFLTIKSNGQLINDPEIVLLGSWPY